MRPGTTTFVADIGTGVVVVRNVKATVCSQCGEDWLDPETADQVERIVEQARARKDEVEVVKM
jgi:YgiT-type zinc finger domain-containing protein